MLKIDSGASMAHCSPPRTSSPPRPGRPETPFFSTNYLILCRFLFGVLSTW